MWESHVGRGVRFVPRRPAAGERLWQFPGMTAAANARIVRRMCEIAGCGYDALGAYAAGRGPLNELAVGSEDHYFCSEALVHVARDGGYLTEVRRRHDSPNHLAPIFAGWPEVRPAEVITWPGWR